MKSFADKWSDVCAEVEALKLKTAALKAKVEKLKSTNSKSTQGCSKCGCRISLKGYCAGCQSRVDWQQPSVHFADVVFKVKNN